MTKLNYRQTRFVVFLVFQSRWEWKGGGEGVPPANAECARGNVSESGGPAYISKETNQSMELEIY